MKKMFSFEVDMSSLGRISVRSVQEVSEGELCNCRAGTGDVNS